MENHNLQIKTKLRDAEDKSNKMEGIITPKLKDTINRQKDITSELEKIYLDAQLLPSMFKAEHNFRVELNKEKQDAV